MHSFLDFSKNQRLPEFPGVSRGALTDTKTKALDEDAPKIHHIFSRFCVHLYNGSMCPSSHFSTPPPHLFTILHTCYIGPKAPPLLIF